MPELPEVETIARGLATDLVGRRINLVHLERSDIVHGLKTPLCAGLRGRRIRAIQRRGKQVRIALDEDFSLFVHLGMSGRLTLADRDDPLESHTHLRLGFDQTPCELRFCDPRRFGGVWLVNGCQATDGWIGRRLPPAGHDPLTMSRAEFVRALSRRRQIKALLLDQQPISGIGNIYCDEALFRAGVHPLTVASRLDAESAGRLWRTMRQVLREAIRAGGSSISDYRRADNTQGRYQDRHRVYHRDGKPCHQCGATIERLVVAGRSTFVCPACQKTR